MRGGWLAGWLAGGGGGSGWCLDVALLSGSRGASSFPRQPGGGEGHSAPPLQPRPPGIMGRLTLLTRPATPTF
ncbi:hypothetical protein E2C01_010231 [Portunus trituberculatus]|uniref:Uncharacterized protein n=1 Tax=Portunus trituberculatus TaxID=210409 RepID=A0A5B7D827_PORTR|nr:hypothetical protein [Portunus trituberculatus]